MALDGLNDVTFDSSSAVLRFGTLKVSFLSFTPCKHEQKVEKIRLIGTQLPSRRTPGVSELGDIDASMLVSDWANQILPRLPKHGGSMVEFETTLRRAHPAIKTDYNLLFSQCRIIGDEEQEIGGDEKGARIKLTVSVMDRWMRGSDGVWKSMSLKPLAAAPPSAAALMRAF